MAASTLALRVRRARRYRYQIQAHRAPDRLRLSVFRSNRRIYAQLIDDAAGRTLLSASTLEKDLRAEFPVHGGTVAAARRVGRLLGDRAVAMGVEKVVYDRGPYKYHGTVRALAEAAREAGLKF